MRTLARLTAGVIRWTRSALPPILVKWRHGYVIVAAAGRALRNGVTDVVLFADLANPVSNAIYQRIGFGAVADSVRIDFATVS